MSTTRLTLTDFINAAKHVHNDKYGYHDVVYNNNRSVITIHCPIHDKFKQVAREHLRGHGCRACADEQAKLPMSIEEFIKRSTTKHGSVYDYSKAVYVNTHTRLEIICSKHGSFEQLPHNHIAGAGCGKCANNIMLTTAAFIKRAKRVHSGIYEYDQVVYTGTNVKVRIWCKTHGYFEQLPRNHVLGHGCKHCATDARKTGKKETP